MSSPAISLPSHVKTVLITGAGGFLGQRLLSAIFDASTTVSVVLTDVRSPPVPSHLADAAAQGRITSIAADLADPADLATLFEGRQIQAVYALHGIMSGGSESDFELGYQVNVDSHVALLKAVCEHQKSAPAGTPPPLYVYTSSLAVYGGPKCTPESLVDPETAPLYPQSSYGAQKAVVELYVFDYTRKGFIDGRILRLPTVAVRPGAPSSAASSYISGLIREPLSGQRAVCPVASGMDDPNLDIPFYVTSTSTVIHNILFALAVPASAFPAHSRTVNLPSITTTTRKILGSLATHGGPDALGLVDFAPEAQTLRIVKSWPGAFVNDGPVEMGFRRDDEDQGYDTAVVDFKRELEQASEK